MQALEYLRPFVRCAKRYWQIVQKRELNTKVEFRCSRVALGKCGASWTFCPTEITGSSLVYSCGVGFDIGFERALAERYGAQIHAFDPTPKSIAWIEKQADVSWLRFHPFGIAAFDGEAPFVPPEDDSWVSHSMIAQSQPNQDTIRLPVKRLSTIMKDMGHTRLDLLKLDIEGAEYEVIRDMLEQTLDVRQILIEFHHRFDYATLDMTQEAIGSLNRAGYRIFSISDTGQEYSFLRPGSTTQPSRP